MRRLLLGLVCTGMSLACRPSIPKAGHTLDSSEEAHPVGSSRRPATPTPDSEPTPTRPLEAPLSEQPSYPVLRSGENSIGNAGPVALEGLGLTGHWVVHCSLPAGTRFGFRGEPHSPPTLTLNIGDKAESISALLSSSKDGRHLVILSEARAWLIDAVHNERFDLSPLLPDLRSDKLHDHRSFAFTRNGLVLLSNQEGVQGYFLSLKDLRSSSEALVDRAQPVTFGKRPVWRVQAQAHSFWATTLPEGSTEKQWPVPAAKQPPPRCLAPSGPYDSYERVSSFRPDPQLRHSWARAPADSTSRAPLVAVEAPGFVAPFENGWVRREDDGRLLLVRGKVQEQIASARCGGRILGADEKTGNFLVSCEEYSLVTPKPPPKKEKPKYRFDLYLLRPGHAKGLGADTARTGVDFLEHQGERLFPLRPGAQAALVDFSAGQLLTLEGDVQVVATGKNAALLRRGNKLTVWTKRGEEPIEAQMDSFTQILTQGAAASVGNRMFVLGTPLRSWTLPEAPLAITELGVALIPKKPAALETWPEGPLLLVGASSGDQSALQE